MSSFVDPGDTYGFTGTTGAIAPGVNASSGEEGDWAPAAIYSAGSSGSTTDADPTGIAVQSALNGSSTDVTGDGENDIVVSDTGTGEIGVLLNSTTAKGTFPTTDVYSAGPEPTGVVLGNFTGHVSSTSSPAILDAAVANDTASTGSASLIANTGTGTFDPPTTYTYSGATRPAWLKATSTARFLWSR